MSQPDVSPERVVLDVLDDAGPDGLGRETLTERVAELTHATQADARDAVERLRRRGEIYGSEAQKRARTSQPEASRREFS